MNTGRLDYIDISKGIAIFFVVMGHVIACFFDDFNASIVSCSNSTIIRRIIYSFHMPLLIFISGFLFVSKRFLSESLFSIWRHKVAGLVFPFIFMGFILYLLRDRLDSYWYLRTLFFYITFQMFYEYLRLKFSLNIIGDVVWSVISFVVIRYVNRIVPLSLLDIVFDYNHLVTYWFYFVIGVLFRRYNVLNRLFSYSCLVNFLPIIAFAYLYLMVNSSSVSYWYSLCGVTVILITLLYMAKSIDFPSKISSSLKYIGTHSLEIYLIHVFLYVKLPMVGLFIKSYCDMNDSTAILNGQCIEFVCSFVLSIIVILLCILIFEPLKCFPLIYRFFLGRKI